MGLHKTGSTSFQNFLYLNKKTLLDFGVIYPDIDQDAKSHWMIPYQLLRNNWSYLEDYFKRALSVAKQQNANTILISAEGFAIMLTESFRVSRFENLLISLGFIEIHWECVLRKQWDSFNSLYAEMSKHKICLNYASAGEEIINFGEISMGNDGFRYRFAFDYDSYIEKFLKEINGSFTAISFEKFIVSDFIGKELLNKHIDFVKDKKTFWESELNFVEEKQNIRRDDKTIEIDYLANFLGISMTNDFFEKNQNTFIPIIQNRLGMIDLVSKDLKKRFMERFPQTSNFL
jgi:hypothetical protein